ncbi:MAG: hypothetical protein ACRDGL_05955, partial [Candidatus Limnocylindrales bacterium]
MTPNRGSLEVEEALAGRSAALLSATVEDDDEARSPALERSIVRADTRAELLHSQRLAEERRAAAGYFICRERWRPFSLLERLQVRLRFGVGVELGGTLESDYLYRPDVALRDTAGMPRPATGPDAPRATTSGPTAGPVPP